MEAHQAWSTRRRRAACLLKRTLVLLPFALVFLASEGLEQALAIDGLVAGVAVAGGIALALRPLHGVARRAAWWLLCREGGLDAYSDHQRLEVYRGTLEAILLDGEVTPRERRILEKVGRNLEIDPVEARTLEQRLRPTRNRAHQARNRRHSAGRRIVEV